MDYRNRHIIFMGTPEFAVESLRLLHQNGYAIDAVVTAVDKPSGRGLELKPSAVKKYAVEQGLPVLQPGKLKDPDFLNRLRQINAPLHVVVAFRMLPREVWALPPLGTINLHASLLPQYRGAAPINRVLMNGEKITGVTTFFIEENIDTGKILFRKPVEIGENEDAGSLHDRLMITGAQLLVKTVDAVFSGTANPVAQETFFDPSVQLKPAPKLSKDDGRINWQRTSAEVHNHIRGLSPYPAAWTILNTGRHNPVQFKIFRSLPLPGNPDNHPGRIRIREKKHLYVATTDGWIEILQLQAAGRSRQDTPAFLNGFSFPEQSFFE